MPQGYARYVILKIEFLRLDLSLIQICTPRRWSAHIPGMALAAGWHSTQDERRIEVDLKGGKCVRWPIPWIPLRHNAQPGFEEPRGREHKRELERLRPLIMYFPDTRSRSAARHPYVGTKAASLCERITGRGGAPLWRDLYDRAAHGHAFRQFRLPRETSQEGSCRAAAPLPCRPRPKTAWPPSASPTAAGSLPRTARRRRCRPSYCARWSFPRQDPARRRRAQ